MTVCNNPANSNIVSVNDRSVLAPKRNGLLKSTAIVAVAFAVGMAMAPVDASAQQAWDGASPGDNAAAGGAGTWDGSGGGAANWVVGAVSGTHTPNIDSTFGTVGGAINVINGAAIRDLTFDVDGYVLSGANLNALNGSRTITVTNGADTAVITNNWLPNGGNVNISKAGAGTLAIGGNMSGLGGTTSIDAGTLSIQAGGSVSGAIAAATGTTLDYANTVNIGNAVAVTGTVNFNQTGGTATQSGVVSGGAFVKAGTGVLILSGANTYTGNTTIDGGTLRASNASALGDNSGIVINALGVLDLTTDLSVGAVAGSGNVTLNGNTLELAGDGNVGVTLIANHSGDISGTGGLIVNNGNDEQRLSGNNTFSGGITVAGGTLSLESDNAAGTGAITTTGSVINYTNGVNIANAITLNSNSTQLQVGVGTATQSGVISQTGGARPLEKIGAGTLILSAANTYTGATTVTAGTLSITGGSLASTDINVNGSSQFIAAANVLAVASDVDLTGTSTFQNSGNNTIGDIDTAAGTTVNLSAGTLIIGSAGNQSVINGQITGPGTLELAAGTGLGAANANEVVLRSNGGFTGNTVLNDFTVAVLSNPDSFGTGTVTVGNNAQINPNAGDTVANNMVLNGNARIFEGGAATATLSGDLSGVGGIEKVGTGTIVLTGTNSYTGITAVNDGVLEFSGAGALTNAGGVVVTNNATLRTDGGAFIAGQTLQVNGTSTFDVNGDEIVGFFISAVGSTTDIDAAATFTVSQAVAGVAAGVIQGAGNLTKSGAATLTLSNAGNTLSGDITVTAGQLTASVAGALGSVNGDVTVNGGILDLGGVAHDKSGADVVLSSGTIQNGTANVATFAQTGGTFTAVGSTAGISVVAIGGTIPTIGTGGVTATNATAAGIDVDTAAGNAINNVAGDGINLNNSGNGNVLVTLGGDVQGSDDGIDIISTGTGTVVVNGSGNVTGGNALGNDGIVIFTNNTNATVTITGNISGDPAIVISSGAGNILVNGVGSVVGAAQAMNLDTSTGNITVTQDATIAPGIQGGSIGIDAQSTISGNIDISGVGNITGQAGDGVFARTAGAGTISINHNGVILGSIDGVDVLTTGTGTVTVTAQQNITGTAGDGIIATSTTGNILIDGAGNITGGPAVGDDGIQTSATTGATTISTNGVISGNEGIEARASAGGNITVNGTGNVTGSGSLGIRALSDGGNGVVIVDRAGVILGMTNGISARSANVGNTGTGTVTVTAQQNVTGTMLAGVVTRSDTNTNTVQGDGAIAGNTFGIDAQALGSGNVLIQGTGATSATGAGSTTINAIAAAGLGSVILNRSGAITNTGTGATTGINASAAGTGLVDVTVGAGGVTVNGAGSAGTGIATLSVSGTTRIFLNSGNVSSTGDGIRAVSTGGVAGASASSFGSGGITITGTGNVTGDSDGSNTAGQDGIDVTTTVGDIVVSTVGTISGDPGIVATSTLGGDITVAGSGNVTGTLAEGILANTTNGNGVVNINRDGVILGATTGVDARSSNAGATGTGTVTVTAAQAITGTAVAGVITQTDTALNTVNGVGAISGTTFGIDAQSLGGGDVVVDGGGTTSSSGAGSTTINAQSTAGNGSVTVNRTGAIQNTGTGTTIGINASTVGTGAINITNTGGITFTQAGAHSQDGIVANHSGGAADITIANNAVITSLGTGSSDGIRATNSTAGVVRSIDIDSSAAITLNAASSGSGIFARSSFAGAALPITIDTTAAGTIDGGFQGIQVFASAAGNTTSSTITANGNIGATIRQAQAAIQVNAINGVSTVTGAGNFFGIARGILVFSNSTLAADGNGDIVVSGTGTTDTNGSGSNTIFARASGPNSDILINRSGAITNTGTGSGNGILAENFGAGTITINNVGPITANGAGSSSDGIDTSAVSGATTVTLNNNVSATGIGINSNSTGAGAVTIGGAGIITATGTGIDATSSGGGIITVNGTGAVTSTTGVAINATSAGNVTSTQTGIISGATSGITASSTAGTATVTTGGNVTGTAGSGISVAGMVANVTVTAGNTVVGGTDALTTSATTYAATVDGTLNAAGTSNNAVNVTAGTSNVTNSGTGVLNGYIQSAGGTTTTTTNAGTWNLTGASTSALAGATDTINNSGTLNTTGNQSITGVEAFTSTGTVFVPGTFAVMGTGTHTLSNTVTLTDVGKLTTSAYSTNQNLVLNNVTINADLNLSVNNTGGVVLSDRIIATGDVTGTGTVAFTLTANSFALQDTDIIVIDADQAKTNTAAITATGLPAAGGLIEYQFLQAANEDWVVRNNVNVAVVGSIVGSLQSTLSVIGAVVNRPSSPFVASPIAPDADTCAPGTWGRGTGGRARISNESGEPGKATNSTSTSVGYAGFQGGLDFGCFNINGMGVDLTAGITGGFNAGNSSASLINSETTSTFESRFIGGYISAQKGSFFADLQARVDFSEFNLNNSNPNVLLNDVDVDSQRFSLTGTMAYSKSVGEYNLVPAIGGTYSHTKTDAVNFAGGLSLKLQDQDDFLGFAGLTINRVFVQGGEDENDDLSAYIPFITGTIYNEFGDAPVSIFSDNFGNTRTVESQNLGFYGEISGGVNYRKIFSSETSKIREIAASVRGDIKFGDRVNAAGITAQIRFQF